METSCREILRTSDANARTWTPCKFIQSSGFLAASAPIWSCRTWQLPQKPRSSNYRQKTELGIRIRRLDMYARSLAQLGHFRLATNVGSWEEKHARTSVATALAVNAGHALQASSGNCSSCPAKLPHSTSSFKAYPNLSWVCAANTLRTQRACQDSRSRQLSSGAR